MMILDPASSTLGGQVPSPAAAHTRPTPALAPSSSFPARTLQRGQGRGVCRQPTAPLSPRRFVDGRLAAAVVGTDPRDDGRCDDVIVVPMTRVATRGVVG